MARLRDYKQKCQENVCGVSKKNRKSQFSCQGHVAVAYIGHYNTDQPTVLRAISLYTISVNKMCKTFNSSVVQTDASTLQPVCGPFESLFLCW
jgi:hypothetical protein